MRRIVALLMKSKSGATAIEYGLIAALVSVAGITALTTMGDKLGEMFGVVGDELQGAIDSANTTSGTGTGTETGTN